jgi:hypothetical protein
MTQKISNPIPTTAVVLSPLARAVRMIVQVVIALAAAIPTILNTPGVSGNAVLAKYAGIITGYLVLVTTVINTLEHFGVIPVLGGKSAPAQVPSLITE